MGNVKLTIGIPTWNRSAEIQDAINSILAQVDDKFRPQLEILISDNASTDATQEVVRGYAEHDPELFSLYRNPENIGFSRNVHSLFCRAKGEFVLVLSDDDALEPDALREIFEALERHPDINSMIVLYEGYDDKLDRPHAPSRIQMWREGPWRQLGSSCCYYTSGVDYYRAHGSLCNTCISGNMFRTSVWLNTDLKEGLASGSIQLCASIQILSAGSVCLIKKPLVKYRDCACSPDAYRVARGQAELNGSHGTNWPFVYFFDLVRASKSGRELYPWSVYRSFYLTCVRGVFYTLLEVKARNGFINQPWFNMRLIECFDAQCHGWLIGVHRLLVRLPYFLFIVPNWMYRLIRKLYFALQPKR